MSGSNCSLFKHITKKVLYLSLLFSVIIIPNNTFSQQMDDAICISGGKNEFDYRKKPWKGNNQFLLNYLLKIDYYKDMDKVRYLVPVKFWNYRKSDGSGGASKAELRTFMTDLNKYYAQNQTGIQFYIREIKNINKTSRQVFGYYLEAPLQTILRHTKPAINVYIVERFKRKQESKKMVRGTYNIFTKSVIIQRENSSTSLSHEIGHHFGLLHPHRHYNMGKQKQEPVSRERLNTKGIPLCQLNGDLLSDTPAEPKLSFLVDNNCNFVGNALKDDWGDNYQSVTDNIMSYPTHYKCRNTFTISQKAIILYTASISKYSTYWNTENPENQKYFFDACEPDDYMEMASIIEPANTQEHNFHKIFLNKGKDATDSCDWIKFEVKSDDKKNIKVTITPDKGNSHQLSATLFDKNKISLSSKKTVSSTQIVELGFENVVSDWYYIQISSEGANTSEKIEKFSVGVDLY